MSMQRLKLFVYSTDMIDLPKTKELGSIPNVLINVDKRFFDQTWDPDEADFIIFPYELRSIARYYQDDRIVVDRVLYGLPFFKSHQRKHVLFLNSDALNATGFEGVFYRVSVNTTCVDRNTIVIPPFGSIEDFGTQCTDLNLVYETSFIGCVATWDQRIDMIHALMKNKIVNYYVAATHQSFGWDRDGQEKTQRRAEYTRILNRSVTVLAPRGAGMFSMRFYEALSMGRIPVLIGDHCGLPLEDEINYDAFILRIPECDIPRIGLILREWIDRHNGKAILEKFALARHTFEQYFRADRVDEFVVKSLWKVKESGYSLNMPH